MGNKDKRMETGRKIDRKGQRGKTSWNIGKKGKRREGGRNAGPMSSDAVKSHGQHGSDVRQSPCFACCSWRRQQRLHLQK